MKKDSKGVVTPGVNNKDLGEGAELAGSEAGSGSQRLLGATRPPGGPKHEGTAAMQGSTKAQPSCTGAAGDTIPKPRDALPSAECGCAARAGQ